MKKNEENEEKRRKMKKNGEKNFFSKFFGERTDFCIAPDYTI